MSTPTNGSAIQIAASAMTNAALAHRIDMLQTNRRAFSKAEADAFLAEAAKRLRWPDVYAAHG